MAKKFYKRRCIYCLNLFDHLTSDHVFPQSWYPDTTPPDMEKWRAPACRNCNSEMGKIENRLLIKMGLCVPPFKRESLGIAHKAMRSLKAEYGHNDHDAEWREKLRQAIIEKAVDPTAMPLSCILPQFGFHSGVDPSTELGVWVSDSDLKAIGRKLIRGSTWVIDKVCIDNDHNIRIFFPGNPMAWPDFFEDLRRFGTLYSLGPGLTIIRAAADGDCQSGIYLIEIWGRLLMYGSVAPVKNQ